MIDIDDRNSRRALERENESNRNVARKAVDGMKEAQKEVERLKEIIESSIMIEKRGIPNGARFAEAYITPKNQLVVLGDPENTSHNCDEMGCSSVSHVLYRFDLEAAHDQTGD